MLEFFRKSDINETPESKAEDYKEIKPDSGLTTEEAKDYWDKMFNELYENNDIRDLSETSENENLERNLEKTLDDYFNDLKEKSDCPDTISDRPFEVDDLEKRSPEENAEMRDEFDDKRVQLKREWEEVNGRPWPKYENDVYSSNGKLIRKAGSDYDAHHIQPLGMGGRNEVSNMTPLNVEVHYDKQGVHAPDSPYSRLDKMLGGMS